jgi:DNA-binding NarL/FixJ family response regulator
MEPATTHGVGILEDDEGLRLYLEDVVTRTEGLTLAFSEALLSRALRRFAETKPDLCLVDLKLPDGSGLDFIARSKTVAASKWLILTALGDRASVLVALRAGADGYLLKDTAPEKIGESIQRVLRGETPISPQAATFLLEMWKAQSTPAGPAPSDEVLTEREAQVLRLFSRGLSYRETAEALEISEHTVRDYVKAIYRKLDVHSRSEAIFEARHLGIIAPFD